MDTTFAPVDALRSRPNNVLTSSARKVVGIDDRFKLRCKDNDINKDLVNSLSCGAVDEISVTFALVISFTREYNLFLLLTDLVFGINTSRETVSMAGWVVVGNGVGIFVFTALTGRLGADVVIDVGGNCFITDWLDKPLIRSPAVDPGMDVALVTVVGSDRLADLVMTIRRTPGVDAK